MSDESNLIPKGRYSGKGLDWILGESATGKPQVAILVELTLPDGSTRAQAWYGFFTKETIESTHKALRAMGWTGDSYEDLTGIDRNVVSCVVDHEADQQGVPRTRIRWINPPLDAGILVKKHMTDGEKVQFGQKFKGKLLELDQKMKAKGGSSAGPGGDPPPPGEADVPDFMRG